MQRSAVRPSPIFLVLLLVTAGGGVLAALSTDEVPIRAGIFVLVIGGWAVSLCLHEFGHAFVAYRGGDWAVQSKGYLTLNPLKYTDPVFSLLLPILFVLIGGIPLPGGAVWINHHALRSRGIESWVSLAGPLTNLVLGIGLTITAAALPGVPVGLLAGLSFLAVLQLSAFILNILPVPGLDGWGAIEPFLSRGAQEFGAKARQWAPLLLFAFLIGAPGVSGVFWDAVYALYEAIGGDSFLADLGRAALRFW